MSNYAKVVAGVVTEVIVADEEFIAGLPKEDGVIWIQTSFNTRGGVHYGPDRKTPSDDQSKALRKNYAGVGFTYNAVSDSFVPPKPFASWRLNEKSARWEPPIAKPRNGLPHVWDEAVGQWKDITPEGATKVVRMP